MKRFFLLAAILALATASASAADPEIALTIRDHLFTPTEIRVPAGKKVRLIVTNADITPEEFESLPLRIERVIPGGTTARIPFGPLKPGRYPFIGEFHVETASGVIVVE